MSDFIFVIPSGWIQIDWQYMSDNSSDLGKINIDNWIATNQMNYITEGLIAINMLPVGSVVAQARLFDSYFIVLLE